MEARWNEEISKEDMIDARATEGVNGTYIVETSFEI